MPELPEVEALAQDLRGRLADRAIVRVDLAAFSALKTYDPPLQRPARHAGRRRHPARQVPRHRRLGAAPGHAPVPRGLGPLARRRCPTTPPRPSTKSPLAARVVLDDGSGLDITEAGTRKRLAIYVVRDPLEVPGDRVARARPARRRVHDRRAREDPPRRRAVPDQGRAAVAVDHRGHRQRLLRRAAARRPDVAVQAGGVGRRLRRGAADAVRRDPRRPRRRRRRAPRGWPPRSSRARRSRTSPCTGGPGMPCPVCGDTVREVSFADSSLQYCPTCQTGGKPLADRRMSKLLEVGRRSCPEAARVSAREPGGGPAGPPGAAAGTPAAGSSTTPSDARCGVRHCTSTSRGVGVLVGEQLDEPDERDLGGVGDPVEHRLAGEQPADRRRRRARRRARRPATPRPSAPSRAGAARRTPPRCRRRSSRRRGVGAAQARDDLVERGVDADLHPAPRLRPATG